MVIVSIVLTPPAEKLKNPGRDRQPRASSTNQMPSHTMGFAVGGPSPSLFFLAASFDPLARGHTYDAPTIEGITRYIIYM